MNVKPMGILLLAFLVTRVQVRSEEGMYPVNELHRLDLSALGLSVRAEQIFQPGHPTLADAVVDLNGGTGSFVSSDGLILTNHHVAFAAVQRASSDRKDYLAEGFTAKTRSEEIPALGYTARISEDCRDVSEAVLAAVARKRDFYSRERAKEKVIKEIVLKSEKENPGKRAEVSEMIPGKSYLLFIYTYLKDIRLVYIPPLEIGNFGGEEDNWMWPRHTGDFSFLRAYTAPDGSAADYSADNVPFHPKVHLRIGSKGMEENDRVFMLGYPARTSRHFPSSFLEFELKRKLPFLVSHSQWQIENLERFAAGQPSLEITFASRLKSLHNSIKNYRSKIEGLHRLHWIQKKKEQEIMMEEFIRTDASRKERYGRVLSDIETLYKQREAEYDREFLLDQLSRTVILVHIARTIVESAFEREKKDLDREPDYMERTISKTREKAVLLLKSFHAPMDRFFLAGMISRAAALPESHRIAPLSVWHDSNGMPLETKLEEMYAQSRLTQPSVVEEMFRYSSKQVKKSDDPFIRLALDLYPVYREWQEKMRRRQGELDSRMALLNEWKREWRPEKYIPDANSTLRFTCGRIRGYSPRDGVYYLPFTTLRGVMEKETGTPPFMVLPRMKDLYSRKEFGTFSHPSMNDIPVAMLYDMDTTGGNSGSPVMNAAGELVGINFDRTAEATINDYLWSPEWSRSIAVDIRYVLWVTRYVGGLERLLEEMIDM